MITIGGPRINPMVFSGVVSNATIRATFVDNLYNFLTAYGFDGVEIDWEYPNSYDKTNFVLLLRQLKIKFGNRLILAVAVSFEISRIGTAYDVPAINLYADFINMATLNMRSQYYLVCISPLYGYNGISINDSVTKWRQAGAQSAKIVFELPFYVNHYFFNSTKDTRVGTAGVLGGSKPYSSYCAVLPSYRTNWNSSQSCKSPNKLLFSQ